MQMKKLLTIFFLIPLLYACAAPPEAPPPKVDLVFPPPPEQPRFYFENSLISSAQIYREDKDKRLRRLLTGETEQGVGFSKPFDVAACGGRIYVSDSVRRVVMAFDVPGARYFEIGVDEPGALIKPLGVNTDADCNLYVVDATAKRINVYAPDGQFQYAVGGQALFERASHVAASSKTGRIFVVDTGAVTGSAHRIRVFAMQTGEHLFDIGKRGREPGALNLPRDIEIGHDGLVYVVDGGNFRIQVFEQDGRFVKSFGSVGRQFGQFARPKGIAADANGNLYVSDASHGNFQIFDNEGRLLLFIGDRKATDGPAKYMLPAGIDVDGDGRVYMVDQFFRKVDIYRPAALAKTGGALGAWYAATDNATAAVK